MMMQGAVGHEKAMAAGNLAVDHPTHIYARLAHEESTELQHDLCLRQARFKAVQNAGKIAAKERKVEALVARKLGKAEATADVEDPYRTRRVLRQAHGE